MDHTHMSLHVIVLLYPHGAQERGCTACVWSVLLSGWSGCRAVSAAVRPLCAVGLSGSCQAVTLGPDSDGAPLMSDSAVRLSDTCCQAVGENAVSAVWLSGTVRRCPQLQGLLLSGCHARWHVFRARSRNEQDSQRVRVGPRRVLHTDTQVLTGRELPRVPVRAGKCDRATHASHT